MSKRLFGTDGIRAVAGEEPLDPATVRRFGVALTRSLGRTAPRVVLGRDTRESGPWLRDALAAGIAAGGGAAVDLGVVTTPGLAWVLRARGYDAGVMISASHNPFEDNGLKAFDSAGVKLSDDVERNIEALILDTGVDDPGEQAGSTRKQTSDVDGYVEHLVGALDRGRLSGLRIALDCANGAACQIAPRVFRDLGAEVLTIGVAPDGRNINLDCGSLHLEKLAEFVRANGCDSGLAFDGDADRCLAVDRHGRVVDGDAILFVTGRRLKRDGRLPGDAVVATIMSNFWLEERLGAEGVQLHRTKVGDKYVLETMHRRKLALGGEQSGHVIFGDHATTGDGILTGLQLLDAVLAGDESLDRIVDGIEPYPQVLINVRVSDKPDLRSHAIIGPAVQGVEDTLAGTGRVVLRYSGTEPLVRVMLEGKDADQVGEQAESLAEVIRDELGV
ncbi:MAG: phosphoglucosamine mutase [Acidobacteria bacterium]|nr:phosphoglucosamine mutase [Acidobacteriota bacterium]NIM60168.1 phosphoglucosamine mutase [Acidobacteriota bacterium]NIO57837.1 phosphoglucosamine mutase [Acidobacteriota bacterium]NIQ28846.1 phosphoglucosamine mutase [Acidobacteriota bacterium]NIQ83304.1 phosphoglucosamine mutase [Acidobacteriota bacterium]